MLIKIWSLKGGTNPREGPNLREGAKPNKYGNRLWSIKTITQTLPTITEKVQHEVDIKVVFREQKFSIYFKYNICYNFRITLSVFEMWQ